MAVRQDKNEALPEIRRSSPLITSRHIYLLMVLGFSAVMAAAFLFLPENFQLPLILAVPAIVVCIYILLNPYSGIYLFFYHSTLLQ